MKRCKTCVYFQDGACDLAESNNGVKNRKDSLAHASDYEGYAARLYVEPNFGCVQHQPIPKKAEA